MPVFPYAAPTQRKRVTDKFTRGVDICMANGSKLEGGGYDEPEEVTVCTRVYQSPKQRAFLHRAAGPLIAGAARGEYPENV